MRTYSGWQHENVSFLLGLSGRRALITSAAVLLALQPIASGHLSNAFLLWPCALLLTAAAFVRIAGRTLDEWSQSVAVFTLARRLGQTLFLSGPFNPNHATAAATPDLPGVLTPLRFLDHAGLAVVHHPRHNTYTAIARLAYPGLGLADTQRQDARVNEWGRVLASLCTEANSLIRLQIVHRTLPEPAAALRSWHAQHIAADAPTLAVEIDEELLATAAPAASRRVAHLAVTFDAKRAALAVKAAGGGTTGACAVLERQLNALIHVLAGAELTVEQWLAPRQLAAVLRAAYDPVPALPDDGVEPAQAGPAGAESTWASYRHDSAVSATFSAASWPLAPVHATCLAALLADCAHRRALSLVLEPLGPRDAQRRVLRERTRREAAIRLRRRTGQAPSALETAQLDRAEEQDRERAFGAGLIRFTAYATATATDDAALDEACAELEAAAAHVGIELRRMYGAQETGFAMTLPLGLGLPRTRG